MKLVQQTQLPPECLSPWPRAAELFPRYDAGELASLAEYRRQHGSDSVLPIVINGAYQIIDGYNRWAEAKASGVDLVHVQVFAYANDDEQEMHAIVLNAKRRHLDSITAARAAQRLAELYAKDAKDAGKAKQAAKAKEQHKTSNPRAGEKSGRTVTTVQPNDRRPSAVDRASQEVGVSEKTVRQVAKVDATGDAELIGAMERHEIPIAKAAKLADVEETERRAVMENIKAMHAVEIEGMQRAADGMRETGAAMFIAGCMDATLKLMEGHKKTKWDKLDNDQLSRCLEALGGLGNRAKEMAKEIMGRMS